MTRADRPETQTIEIARVLGIRRAEIPLTPGVVTHVVGLNGAGKSSIAVCAQALLARAVDPLGLGRARAGYAGGGTAPYARLGGTVWRPTQGSVEIEEGQRASSPAAVGLVDFTARLDATRRREAIAAALGIDTRAIAAIAHHVHGSDAADAEQRVGAEGWAAAEAVYRDRARRAKREWREIAGEQYGVAKAADWAPAGWHADLDSLDPAGARAAIADAQEAHEEAVRNTGASDAQRAARAKAIADLPELRERHDELEAEAQRISAERGAIPTAEARRRRDAASADLNSARRIVECPRCGAHLRIEGTSLAAAEDDVDLDALHRELQAAELVLREHDRADAEQAGHVQRASAARDSARGEVMAAEAIAREELPEEALGDGLDAPAARESLDRARADLARLEARERASELHCTVVRYEAVAKALAPGGVRSQVMGRALGGLRAGLRALAEEAGSPPIEITDDGDLTWDGRPIAACSESERWRAQACMQLTIAALDGSPAVVLDRGDVLDEHNRVAIVPAIDRVASSGIAILICATGTGVPEGLSTWEHVVVADGETAL